MGSSPAYSLVVLFLTSSAAPAATVTGKVVDERGQPVAGAKIWLYFSGETELVATTLTGADGAFSLDDPEHESLDRAEHDRYYVLAYKAGLSLDQATVEDTSAPLTLTLGEAAATRGCVLGEGGKPLADALVTVVTAIFRQYAEPGHRRFTVPEEVGQDCNTRTDADGVFSLHAVPAGWQVRLRIAAAGYGQVMTDSEADLSSISLEPAGSLRGKLVFEEPPDRLKHCRLYVFASLDDRGLYAYARAAPDEEGQFTLAELPPGPYGLTVMSQPSSTEHLLNKAGIQVKPREETVIELKAQPTFPVRGRVIASGTGEGIPGVQVSLARYEREAGYRTEGRSQADGTFSVPCIAGKCRFSIKARGFAPPAPDQRVREVEVGPQGAKVPDIKLERLKQVTFQVVDEKGQAVEGAFVAIGKDLYSRVRGGLTDAQGTYVATDLAPGTIKAWADKGDLGVEQSARVNVGQEQGTVKLTIKSGVLCTVTARIVDQDGKPAPDAVVSLQQRYKENSDSLQCGPPDEDGRFRKTDVRPDLTYRLAVRGLDCDIALSDEWVATRGASHDFGTIALRRREGFLAGSVVDEAGERVPGASVFNVGGSPKKVSDVTDAEGHFRLGSLRPGPALLFVDSPGHDFAGMPVEISSDDLQIVLNLKQPAVMADPPAPRQRSIPEEEGRRLARSLLLEILEQTKGAKGYGRERLLTLLAGIDPEAAFQAATEGGDATGPVALAVGRAHLEEDFDEAVALIRQHEDPFQQAWELYEAANEELREKPELARRCIEEGLSIAAAVPDPAWALTVRARLAKLLIPLDEARAADLLAELHREASALGVTDRQAYARGVVAEQICERDLDAALALVEPLEEQSAYDRHLSNIARRVAKTDPDRALELIDQLREPRGRPEALAVVLTFFPRDRMTEAADLARNLERGFARALALTRLASVAPQGQQPRLLEQAVEAVGASRDPNENSGEFVARIACVARRLGHPTYEEFGLRAASLRTLWNVTGDRYAWQAQTDMDLARVLAFVQPEMARFLVEDVLRNTSGARDLPPSLCSGVASAAAHVDPRWAVELVRRMPPDDLTDDYLPRAAAVGTVIRNLLESPDDIETETIRRFHQYSWLPVDRDW